MAFKLTLTYPLYTRTTPSNEERPLGYLEEGSVIDVADIVIGKPIDSNSIWYKTAEGVYYWSGGADTAEFVFPGKDFMQLTLEKQDELVSQAMEYYYDRLSAKIDGFTGMSVTFKKSKDQYKEHYALVIQVAEKKAHPSFMVPDALPYYGFAIPTDVVVASRTMSSGLGDTISRKGKISFGSAGFLTTRINGNEILLITNYHVACTDLMLRMPRKLSLRGGDNVDEPAIVMPAKSNNIIGSVVEGRLDQFNDVALVKLNSFMTNDIPSIGAINGIRTMESLENQFKPGTIPVRMFGARSGITSNGFIESCNSTQTIFYLNDTFKHKLKGLIQVTAMSAPGDSGSAVVDTGNNLVGILVGGNSHFSYVLPVENILQNFNLNNP